MTRALPDPPVIVVTGFMATGKTTVGRIIAEKTGLTFVDTDTEIEKRTGMTIADIFDKHGEMHFRELEQKLCAELAQRRDVVIATGGGTLLDERNHSRFTDHAHIFRLEVPLGELSARAGESSTRPLLADDGTPLETRLAALLDARKGAYARIGRAVDNHGRGAEATAAVILAAIDFPTSRLSVNPLTSLGLPDPALRGRFGVCRMDIGRGVLNNIGRRLDDFGIAARAFVLLPRKVDEHFHEQLEASLSEASVPHHFVEVDDGDSDKHLDQVRHLIDTIAELGAKRDSTIVAVGGGVTGDIAGFVASAFMRGIPLVQVPTTLLAQVDSSIGGKVGVNLAAAKNMVGAFYQPHLIVCDPAALRTLPPEEIANGMAEVVKSALIGSESLFDAIETQTKRNVEESYRDAAFLERCVTETAAIKCRVVNEDPLETGRRRVLNLGHTVGHALEAAGDYGTLKHGQAVSIGMVAALRIAAARGVLDSGVVERTKAVLQWCGLPVDAGDYDRDRMMQAMRHDKKAAESGLRFVLPTGIGHVRIVDDVTPDEILTALETR